MALLGIDLGGTKVALCVGTEDGEILTSEVRPTTTSGDAAADLKALVGQAQALWKRSQDAGPNPIGDRPSAIGLSVPGPIDPEAGLLLNPPNLAGWTDVPIVRAFADAFGAPVGFENDANAAALAEWRYGAGQGVRDMAYLTMSTGVGGGLILDGRLHRGARGGAGEVGHAPIARDGLRCACGLRGCLEAYCGGVAWQTRLRAETPADSDIVARAGSVDAIRPEHVLEAAKAGDAFANQAFGEWLDNLSMGLAQLVMSIEPERIVLGTIAIAAGEALCFAPLRERLATRVWAQQAERTEIVPASLAEDRPFRAGLAAALERPR